MSDPKIDDHAIAFNEIVQVTKLRSKPRKSFLSQLLPNKSKKVHISPLEMLARRETNYSRRSGFTSSDSVHISDKYLPFNSPSVLEKYLGNIEVAQYSADGTLFVSGMKYTIIKIYSVDNGWKVTKVIHIDYIRSNLTNAVLSPDKSRLVYTTMSHIGCIVDVESDTDVREWLDFSGKNVHLEDNYDALFAVLSLKFTPDGRSVVAGCKDRDNSIYIYDIEKRMLNVQIPAHKGKVAALAFADEAGDVFYSGGNDYCIKVWDRRFHNAKAVGVLTGHLGNIRCIDSRGDGHYLISNGGDYCIRLWDIRKMTSTSPHAVHVYNTPGRPVWEGYDVMDEYFRTHRHPNDQSVSTYRVYKGACSKCYFSPLHSTGQKYIYIGSNDTCVFFDLVTGAQVARLSFHKGTVVDCSWHPFNPEFVSSAVDGVLAKWSSR